MNNYIDFNMKYKVIITIILFIFSFLLVKIGAYIIRDNDPLMIVLKEKQAIYNKKPVNAIITEHIMIPGISGRKINLKESYKKMKAINEFKESLLVFDKIPPSKTINNIYDKVIISGNQSINKISIVLDNDDNYCFTTKLEIDNNCHSKYTIHIEKIRTNYLTKVKELARNGAILFLELKDNKEEVNLIYKYLKNNNYEIVPIKELITE